MKNMQEAANLENTVRISARRFEESPFIERTDSPHMVRGVYAGRYLAIYLGEDVDEKYWTLRRKALIFDVPEKPVEISGPDAVPFLEKVLAREIAGMQEGRGYYAIACTPQGGVFMDGVIFKLETDRYRIAFLEYRGATRELHFWEQGPGKNLPLTPGDTVIKSSFYRAWKSAFGDIGNEVELGIPHQPKADVASVLNMVREHTPRFLEALETFRTTVAASAVDTP